MASTSGIASTFVIPSAFWDSDMSESQERQIFSGLSGMVKKTGAKRSIQKRRKWTPACTVSDYDADDDETVHPAQRIRPSVSRPTSEQDIFSQSDDVTDSEMMCARECPSPQTAATSHELAQHMDNENRDTDNDNCHMDLPVMQNLGEDLPVQEHSGIIYMPPQLFALHDMSIDNIGLNYSKFYFHFNFVLGMMPGTDFSS